MFNEVTLYTLIHLIPSKIGAYLRNMVPILLEQKI